MFSSRQAAYTFLEISVSVSCQPSCIVSALVFRHSKRRPVRFSLIRAALRVLCVMMLVFLFLTAFFHQPFLAAGDAAEVGPPVCRVLYFHDGPAHAARKGIGRLRPAFSLVLPVQAAAPGRAEFLPLIRLVPHCHQGAAAGALERPQRRSRAAAFCRLPQAVAVRVPAAAARAVDLRLPARCKSRPADRADCFPLHLDLPVHAEVELVRVFVVVAEGLFHVEEHVRPLAELVREAQAHVVPRAFVFVRRAEASRRVAGVDVLVA